MRSSSAQPPFHLQLTTGIPETLVEPSDASFLRGMHPIVSSMNQISPEFGTTAKAKADAEAAAKSSKKQKKEKKKSKAPQPVEQPIKIV